MQYINYPAWLKPEIIPGLPFRWYGVMYLVAFVIAYFLFMYQVKKRKLAISSDLVLSLFFWAIVGLLIGARIFATTIYDPTHKILTRPWLIFWPFDDNGTFTGFQGMSFHGGLLGAAVAILIFCRVKKIDFLEWGDMLVNGIPLGYTFGRLGNFINGELYGKVSDAPWSMLFPTADQLHTDQPWVVDMAAKTGVPIPDGAALINLPRHPSQLYEGLFEGLILWLIMWFIVRNHRPYKGFSIGIYLLGYAVARFFIEYFRQPDPGLDFIIKLGPQDNPPELFESLLNFSMGQILNFLMILGAIICLIVFQQLDKRRPKAETFVADSELSEKESLIEQRRRERRKTRRKLK